MYVHVYEQGEAERDLNVFSGISSHVEIQNCRTLGPVPLHLSLDRYGKLGPWVEATLWTGASNRASCGTRQKRTYVSFWEHTEAPHGVPQYP